MDGMLKGLPEIQDVLTSFRNRKFDPFGGDELHFQGGKG